jgi:hypothetical protein
VDSDLALVLLRFNVLLKIFIVASANATVLMTGKRHLYVCLVIHLRLTLAHIKIFGLLTFTHLFNLPKVVIAILHLSISGYNVEHCIGTLMKSVVLYVILGVFLKLMKHLSIGLLHLEWLFEFR